MVRVYNFKTKVGLDFATATPSGDIEFALPVYTAAEAAAINALISYNDKVVDFDTGPLPVWYNLTNAGYNPPRQARGIYYPLPSNYEGTLRDNILTAAVNHFGFTHPAQPNTYDPTSSGIYPYLPDIKTIWLYQGENPEWAIVIQTGGGGQEEYKLHAHVRSTSTPVTSEHPLPPSYAIDFPSITPDGGPTAYVNIATLAAIDNGLNGYTIAKANFKATVQNNAGGFYNNNTGDFLTQYPQTNSTAQWILNSLDFQEVEYIQEENPYEPGGDSDVAGGTGNFDNSSDPIPIPGLPSVSVTDAGFISIYNPTLAQLKQLSDYMWVNDIGERIRNLFADPMDVVISLTMLPVNIPHGSAINVKVGNVSTNVPMYPATSQWVEVDCGEIPVREYFGGYMDYAPNTKISIYLPFIGYQTLDTDEVMGTNVGVKYHVDILTGTAVAYVTANGKVLYQYSGQITSEIPVTAGDMRGIMAKLGGLLAKAALPAVGAYMAGPAGAGAGALVGEIMGGKKEPMRAGNLSSTAGILSVRTPYLIITRPRQVNPARYAEAKGYPLHVTKYVKDLSGYTVFSEVHVENTDMTAAEAAELETILKGGAYL